MAFAGRTTLNVVMASIAKFELSMDQCASLASKLT
jgi:hypothetical protein